MKKHVWPAILLLIGLPALILTACGGQTSLDEPPEILYGQDVCDECNMIINEPKHAAAYVTAAGEARRFDDIGDMLVHDRRLNEDVHRYWVHDFNTEEWLNAETAVFVVNSGRATPMGWGILAFADEAAAEAFIAANAGTTATWADLLSGAVSPPMDMDMGDSKAPGGMIMQTGMHGRMSAAGHMSGPMIGPMALGGGHVCGQHMQPAAAASGTENSN